LNIEHFFLFLDSGQEHAGMTPGVNVGRIPRMRRFTDRSGNNPYTQNVALRIVRGTIPTPLLYGLFREQSLLDSGQEHAGMTKEPNTPSFQRKLESITLLKKAVTPIY